MSQSDFVSRGQALVASGQYQEAVKVCRLGLLGRPTTVEGRVVLGQALLALKRFDEVLAEMRVALELDARAVGAHTLRAEAFIKKGDTRAAIEALDEARAIAPGDPRVAQLYAEVRSDAPPGRPAFGAAHPAVGFVGTGDTKHYPNHAQGDGVAGHDRSPPLAAEDASDGFTKPSLHAAPRRGVPKSRKDPTPPAAILAVGDKSGTVEVDPEVDGVRVDDDRDFDELAAPPAARSPRPPTRSPTVGAKPATKQPQPQPQQQPPPSAARPARPASVEVSDDSIDSIDSVELDAETGSRDVQTAANAAAIARRTSALNVRAQVKMPSGPLVIDEHPSISRSKARTMPPPFGQIPADVAQVPTLAPPAAPLPPVPRGPLAAALPTVAAQPMPPQPMSQQQQQPIAQQPPSPQQIANAQRKTIAIQPQGAMSTTQPDALAQPAMHVGPIPPMYPSGGGPAENWAVSAPHEPTVTPSEPLDYRARELLAGGDALPEPVRPSEIALPADIVALPPGPRRARSRLSLALWVVAGAAVIGGGVFAGFQIRAMRLGKQIAAAKGRAAELAKADTFGGWSAARDDLASIAQASATPANRAALARVRGLIAYEFGDGLEQAEASIAALHDANVPDAYVAHAYIALAHGEGIAAKLAANQALGDAPNDAGALYVAGQAKLLTNELGDAVRQAKGATDGDARPLYLLGLARVYAALYRWDDAAGAIKRALEADPAQPAATIAQALLLADAGRLVPGAKDAADVRTRLLKLIDAMKPPNAVVMSRIQLAFAELALARVDFARGDSAAAVADINAAAKLDIEDQRFAELAVETLLEIGETKIGEGAAQKAIDTYPSSRRAKLALVRIYLAEGKTADALAIYSRHPDLAQQPLGLALHGQVELAAGDVDAARADFDAARAKGDVLEPLIVGDAELALATGDVEEARRQVEPRMSDQGTPPAIAIVYAAVLRRGDDAAKAKARTILEQLAAGAAGAETPRAQLELARVDRDVGDYAAARKLYAQAGQAGNADARLEGAVLALDDRDPQVGKDELDALLAAAGQNPPAPLVLATARARMLVGDDGGAAQLLETADKLPNVAKWQLQRERGRLYMRRGDLPNAVTALGNALEGCGGDAETFLLATDAATLTTKSGLADKVKKLTAERLKGRPEAQIVSGKLLLADGRAETIVLAKQAYHDAKEALVAQKALPRLIAQAAFGLAVVAWNDKAFVDSQSELKYALYNDPSLYDAYLFMADILKDQKSWKDAFEQARLAVKYNSDYPAAWVLLGKIAAAQGDKATLAEAIDKLGKLAPGSPDLQDLQKLRKK